MARDGSDLFPDLLRQELYRPVASRGMVTSVDRLDCYQQAAAILNQEAGHPLYIIELHSDQTDFTGQKLSDKQRRVVITGGWLQSPYSDLSNWWEKVRELRDDLAEG